MRVKFDVEYEDRTIGEIEFEKPAGAHPESELTVSTAFLTADTTGKVAVAVRRGDDWITRKTAANSILNEIIRRNAQSATPSEVADNREAVQAIPSK